MAVSPGQVPDCVFYGTDDAGAWADLVDDISGEATDLTQGTTSGYETNSTRANLTERRTVDFHGDQIDNTEAGYMFKWDRGGGDYSAMRFNSGTIDVTVDGGSNWEQWTPTDLNGADEWLVVWAMEPNPDTTGASDARRSEIHAFNLSQGDYDVFTWTHEAESGTGTGTLIFGASNTSDSDTIAGDVLDIRLSSGFHSSAESYETWVAQSTAPTLTGKELRPVSMPDRGDVVLGDDGQFAGPIHIIAAKACEQHKALLWGPVVNDVNNDGDFLGSNSNGSGYNSGYTFDGRSLRLEHGYYRPIPLGATHVVPYVYVQSNEVTTATDLEVAVYSMSQPGPLVKPSTSPEVFEHYDVSTTVDDHGSGDTDGEWVELDKLRVARDKVGSSYFFVGFVRGSGNTCRIKTVALDPIFDESDGGLGVGGFG